MYILVHLAVMQRNCYNTSKALVLNGDIIETWYSAKNTNPKINANNINETLQFLFDTYPSKKKLEKEEIALFI